jgi:hypothetical protein
MFLQKDFLRLQNGAKSTTVDLDLCVYQDFPPKSSARALQPIFRDHNKNNMMKI